MKSYLLAHGNRIPDVYSTTTLRSLHQEAGLSPDTILTREDILAGKAKDADYLFSTWGMPHFSIEEIRSFLPCLKAVFYAAGSVQGFAHEFLSCGIQVFSAWGANAVPVVEYTVSQIILANKGFFQSCRRFQSPASHLDSTRFFSTFPGNYDCTVGILGAGMIGRSVIQRLTRDYHLRVLVYDPFYSDDKAQADGVQKASLEEIFTTCQTISNHIANLPSTVGMLSYDLFSCLKPNATFINTGRGAQIIESDLIRALQAYPDRTAVLDVTLHEPPEMNSPLYSLPNVFLTPHIAGSAGNEVHRMAESMLEEFRLLTVGKPTRYSVSLEMLKTMA